MKSKEKKLAREVKLLKSELKADRKRVSPETKQSVFAVLLVGVAAVLVLARLDLAGPAGALAFRALERLFGWGYYLLPGIALVVAIFFLASRKRSFVGITLLGALLFVLTGLGLIDLIASGRGGIVGALVGTLDVPFGSIAAIVLMGAFFLSSLLLTFNLPLRIPQRLAKEKTPEEKPLIIESPGAVVATPAAAPAIAPPAAEEKDEEIEIRVAKPREEQQAAPKPAPVKAKTAYAYVPPPLELLRTGAEKPTAGDLRANANIIKRTLESFGIPVEMGEINIGPKVTRYTLKPAEGVKLTRILALNQDLALALAAHPIRIEAPIPGKSLVGIEVPNKTVAIVRLGNLLGLQEFAAAEPLAFALGRNVSGEPIFTNIERMPHLLIAGSTGSGKTCAADTYVFSERGMLTFNELCPLPPNTQTECELKVATRDGIETTSRTYNNGMCNFFRIETEEGYEIEVTAEHPLWVLDRDGTMKWRAGDRITEGDYVAIARGNSIFGSLDTLNFQAPPNKTNKARPIQIPDRMTPGLGLLLGLLTADGGLTISNRVVYTQANRELLRIYHHLLKELFGIATPRVTKSGRSNRALDVIVNSRRLKQFFSYLGMQPVGAREKEIPNTVRMSRPEVIKAFLQGMMRNDGHISKVGMEFTVASRALAAQTHLMLLNFGIISSLKPKTVKSYPDRAYWRLALYGEEFAKYAAVIGFLTKDEEKKAQSLITKQRNPNKNVVPNLGTILRQLASRYRGAFAKLTNDGWRYQANTLIPKYAFANLKSYNNGDRRPGYPSLQKILNFYQPLSATSEYKNLEMIHEAHFYWARVARIERTHGEGYDFEVPGSNSFVGNGFVNHNSVMIHALLLSLLYRNSPESLRLILIDPKRVELSIYEGIPHLVSPVITETKKTVAVFRWAIQEMERRYELLLRAGARDTKSYNKNPLAGEPLPYLLIVIDELADLMATYGREVEGSIVRLAQMARATGLHLVLSTQRPSVEVITGLIKANITTRIAMQVASQIDSRTILDTAGAEKLLGGGDLLFVSSEFSKPRRIQGAYVSEEEIKNVTNFIVEHNEPVPYAGAVLENGGEPNGGANGELFEDYDATGDDDPLYAEAVALVREAKKASASLLQRRLKVGYARAARLLDTMEEQGVVGPGEGAKPREILE